MTESATGTVSTGVDEMPQYDVQQGPVIAVDGPAGSGKSTAARRVATELGLRYLDTGAITIDGHALTMGTPVADERATGLSERARQGCLPTTGISLGGEGEGGGRECGHPSDQ